MRPLFLTLLAGFGLLSCDDTLFGGETGPDIDGEGYCAVEQIVQSDCFTCHSAAANLGDLDLETDPAAVYAGTGQYDLQLVVPGDPEGSFLYQKLINTQPSGTGSEMPPASGGIAAEKAEIFRAWIADGGVAACDGSGPVERYHPEGYNSPLEHGPDAKFQTERCVNCHGVALEGATGPACETCHGPGWESNCQFCHGSDPSGLPPRDIDGQSDPALSSFPPHDAHSTEGIGPGFECTQCHLTPESALSDGHVFLGDPTPGEAEVRLWWGLSQEGSYDGLGCSNLYCHGNGQTLGSVEKTDEPRDCASCHDGLTGPWPTLSGAHRDHLEEGIACADCHGTVVTPTGDVIHPLHVNRSVEVTMPDGVIQTGSSCTGLCHDEDHQGEDWR